MPVWQHGLDEWPVGQTIGEAHHHHRAFLCEAEEARLLPAIRRRQRHAGKNRQIRVELAIRQQHLHIHGEAQAEAVAQAGRRRRIRYRHHAAEAGQVITAGQLGELPLYAAADCVVHLMAILLSASVTLVMRSPWRRYPHAAARPRSRIVGHNHEIRPLQPGALG